MKFLIHRLAAVMAIVVALVGCSNGNQQSAAGEPSSKQVVLAAPRDLTPGPKDGYYTSLILQVWEPLVTLAEDGSPAPALATQWTMSADGKEWTISLRENVAFHDGEPFNADAAIANIERVVKHSPKKSPFYTLDAAKTYPGLARTEKSNDHTMKLVFTAPSPSAIQRLTNFGSPMVSPKCLDGQGDFSGVVQGTGPFRITEHRAEQFTVLEENPKYWGERAKVRSVKVLSMPSADTRAAALRSGEIHGVLDIGAIWPSQAAQLATSDEFVISSRPSTITHFLQVNQSRPQLNDRRLVKAMSAAIDRKLIVNELYHGYALASANPLNASELGFVADTPVHDLDQARRLAAEVLGDQRLALELLVPQYGIDRYPYKEQAEYVQSALKQIGIDVTITIVEGSEQQKRRAAGNFDLSFHTQGMPDGDPVTMLKVFMGPGNGGRYNDPGATALLNQAATELNPERRMDLYRQLQRVALETLPTLALYHDHSLVVHHRDLQDYQATAYGVTLSRMHWAA